MLTLVAAALHLTAAEPVAATPGAGDPDPPATVAEVVEAMIERYEGLWYRDFTFVQTVTYYDGDGAETRTETWYESLKIPGRLRIDVAPLGEGRTILYSHDVLYRFRGGEPESSNPSVHPLLLMGFDVCFMALEEVLAKLEGLGVALDRMHRTSWQGRPVWVLGAEAGDETSHQCWIDEERLVFVRQLNGGSEVQFNRYERMGRAWVAPEVVFINDGRITMLEEYYDMSIERELDDSAFLADGGVRPSWIPAGWAAGGRERARISGSARPGLRSRRLR